MKTPVAVAPDSKLEDAIALVLTHQCLPVVYMGKGKKSCAKFQFSYLRQTVIGLLSRRDIEIYIGAQYALGTAEYEHRVKTCLSTISVNKVMTRKFSLCIPSDSIVDAAKIMQVHMVSTLPVVESEETGQLIGIITRSDLLDQLIRLYEPLDHQLFRCYSSQRLLEI